METLEEAIRNGCDIQREVRYFAKHPNGGYLYSLRHDWTVEMLDRSFVDKRLNDLKKKYDKETPDDQ